MLRFDLQFFSGEKTEKATPQKRRDARKKGQVAKSPEVSSALTLLLSFSFLLIGGKNLVAGCFNIFIHCFQDYLRWDVTIKNTQVLYKELLIESAQLIAPFFAIVVAAGLIANFAQVGFMINPEGLKMKFSKINPLQGAKNIFSFRTVVELIKSILKISVTSTVVFLIIWNQRGQLVSLGEKNIWDTASFIGSLILQIGVSASGCLIVLAAADYFYQKFEYEKKLRMSKQEIKEEFKKMEGDPHIKGKRKAKQRELAMKRMMQEVPKADVVITNPTHFAVAIRYDINTMDAPLVIAKGQDHVALKIKEIAKQNKIMTVENRPLARALFASVEIGETIPEELFNAVGEILAYVYYQEGRYKGMMT
ncbi:flagellar biosynthesis protein FlhB [Bacillus sp. BRMEA1]|uniref:flagellar biosynthesis protein FlhB n=1 Tax=Neobacillus endophyticus TaxID=2738405 RepID=UPI001564BCC9|nr:flagellar biosynthesis protein FlhB [Neobacillus endophyticus]NRD79416.1 flagellar biosynthesis protein FlhB [Neobacillus endophyticus]